MKPIQNKTQRMLALEIQFKRPIEEVLQDMYVNNNMHASDMMRELGLTKRIIFHWLELAGIYSRRLNLKGGDED